jgi:predicted metal-dependent hydrolase
MNPLGKLQMGLFDWLMPSADAAAQPTPQYVARHPQANREVRITGVPLPYQLRRSSRKTIGLQVGSEGLCVTAPRWALVADIERVVLEKGPWVLDKMRQMRARDLAHHQQAIEWQDGVCLPYMGTSLCVRLCPDVRMEGLTTAPDGVQGQPVLQLRLSPQASGTQIRDKTQAWLMQQARTHFAQRLDAFAPRLGVAWTQLRLSQAKTRWGSANVRGVICLNWRLIHHAPSIIDYVVVHELSHLRVMNHSPAFWETVASVLPDYKQQRHALKKDSLPPW